MYALSNFLYVEWTTRCKLYKYTESYTVRDRRDVTDVWPELVTFLTTKFSEMGGTLKEMFVRNEDVYIFDSTKTTTLNRDTTLPYADTLWPGNIEMDIVTTRLMSVYQFGTVTITLRRSSKLSWNGARWTRWSLMRSQPRTCTR